MKEGLKESTGKEGDQVKSFRNRSKKWCKAETMLYLRGKEGEMNCQDTQQVSISKS